MGLEVANPESIGSASNVLVHLRPSPVVARVMTATIALHPDTRAWLTQELAVARFLVERGAAIVPPSERIDPGPHTHDGYWMTFWGFVGHDAGRRLEKPEPLGRCLRDLHEALADYPGDLPTLAELGESLTRLLGTLRPDDGLSRDELAELQAELERLMPLVFEAEPTAPALHGDASLSNLLRTDRGLLWNDFEDVCRGPVEWDLASLIGSVRHRGADDAYVDEVLRAYGFGEAGRLTHYLDAHALYGAIWNAFQSQRNGGAPTA